MQRPPDVTRRRWAAVRVRATTARARDRWRGRRQRLTRRISTALVQKGTLSIVGLGFLAAACYQYGLTVGLIGTGVVLLVIDGRILS